MNAHAQVSNVADFPALPTSASPPSPAAPTAKGGGGKGDKTIDWNKFNDLCDNFVLIYTTDNVYDCKVRKLMPVSALRISFGSDYVKMWLQSDKRRMISPEQLVFDPSNTHDDDCVNLFDRLPLTPKKGECKAIIDLLHYLCSKVTVDLVHQEEIYTWVERWIAYPLQHPGAKMRTALAFNGFQGAGKNLYFEEVIGKIYGQYHRLISQFELGSQFNDWASQAMLVIGDEVVSRQELYNDKNILNYYITGKSININPKNLARRVERNGMNFVFNSNEDKMLAVPRDDRRYLVINTPPKLPEALRLAVADCLASGGVEAYFYHLLHVDLKGFDEFSQPPMTDAKKALIDLGSRPTERFANEWLGSLLSVPVRGCTTEQCYRLFGLWCRLNGERQTTQRDFSFQLHKAFEFFAFQSMTPPLIELQPIKVMGATKRFWVPTEGAGAPGDQQTLSDWAAGAMSDFEMRIKGFASDHFSTKGDF